MKTQAVKFSTTLLIAALIFASCTKSDLRDSPAGTNVTTTVSEKSDNGRSSAREVYYDDELFTVNMFELSDDAAESIIEHNTAVNEIYASNDLDEPQDFLSVIDAVPADGMNPLWLQFLIVFNDGFTPHQFTSEEDVEAAAEGPNPEITLVNTGEIYRCSVIGPK